MSRESKQDALTEYKLWVQYVKNKVSMRLPPGLVGYRLVGSKGSNIVPIAKETKAVIIIIPVRGPPREVCIIFSCIRAPGLF